jgi:hypothetical protein
MHKGLYNLELVRTQFKTLKLNCRDRYSFGGSGVFRSRSDRFLQQACVHCYSLVEKAWPRSNVSALLARRVPRIGAYQASFPRPIMCGARAGFPSGVAGSSGPCQCVPIASALRPLAVHRWLYHWHPNLKSARCQCFAPFTTGLLEIRTRPRNAAAAVAHCSGAQAGIRSRL